MKITIKEKTVALAIKRAALVDESLTADVSDLDMKIVDQLIVCLGIDDGDIAEYWREDAA